jgi:hypothetical protein
MGFGAAAMMTASAINVANFLATHRPLDQLPFVLVPAVASLVVGARIAYLVALRLRQRRHGA